MIKTLHLNEDSNDVDVMRKAFEKILSVKTRLPKDFQLKIEYGNAQDFIMWDVKKIEDWVKADKHDSEVRNMSLEQRFALLWNSAIDDIAKDHMREWLLNYKEHVKNDLNIEWDNTIEKIVKTASTQWLNNCRKHGLSFYEMKDGLTSTCDELIIAYKGTKNGKESKKRN